VEYFHWLPSVATFLMLFFVFDPSCAGSRLLGSAWLRFTGIVSYEWFLFHGPVVNYFSETFGKTHGSLLQYGLKTVAPLAVTFVFSVAVYRWFSLPILNRIRDSIKGRSAA
jgi:peptidoglycan/LPS O-acetylase OafA/YrhL